MSDSLATHRRRRADEMDARLSRLLTKAVPGPEGSGAGHGLALVAVGGYGRSELSPSSDVDVVLVHDRSVRSATADEIAAQLWYPLWDDGVDLDHAVRSVDEMHDAAAADYRAAIGMLDARSVAGDAALVRSLRSTILTDWRRSARRRLPELRASTRERIDRAGWLAQSAVPDLKDAGGGLRDGVVMRALVATWLVDVPHRELEFLRTSLLDVRDVLHEVSGRRTDRLTPEIVPEVAVALGHEPEQLDLHVRDLGRRSAHLGSITWRRVDQLLGQRAPLLRTRRGGPRLSTLVPGVAELDGEVLLTAEARPRRDPLLALRASVEAARSGRILSPPVAARLAASAAPLLEPWPDDARRLLVALLTAGTGLVSVWEEIDLAGLVDRWLPEWAAIRLRGSSSPVHRFTIDRHSIETCVIATSLLRTVARPDLVAVAALVHDIGKGFSGDHSETGAPVAEGIARRWGFDDGDAARIGHLVRWHLLLPTVATRRDIEDPATVAGVADIVGDVDTLDLLAVLTEADARSTGPTAWTPWRAGLIEGLVRKVRTALDARASQPDPMEYDGWPQHRTAPEPRPMASGALDIVVTPHRGGSLVEIDAADRPALMADLAGGLTLAGLEILSARVASAGTVVSTLWEVTRADLDAAQLGLRLRRVFDGTVDLRERLEASVRDGSGPTRVIVHPESSPSATVVEVRATDRRGLVWALCSAITDAGYEIRSAHLSTFGPEARDVFYVVDRDGVPLEDASGLALCHRIEAALDLPSR